MAISLTRKLTGYFASEQWFEPQLWIHCFFPICSRRTGWAADFPLGAEIDPKRHREGKDESGMVLVPVREPPMFCWPSHCNSLELALPYLPNEEFPLNASQGLWAVQILGPNLVLLPNLCFWNCVPPMPLLTKGKWMNICWTIVKTIM